jgi:hypothetical protein
MIRWREESLEATARKIWRQDEAAEGTEQRIRTARKIWPRDMATQRRRRGFGGERRR